MKTLSGGQQRRLDMGLGIIGGPDLLFLDEPTTGFDPSARRGAWDVVRSLAGAGTTILLTTHYMDEAQHLADRVAVINQGRIVAEGSPDSIGGRADAAVRIRFAVPAGTSGSDLPVGCHRRRARRGRADDGRRGPRPARPHRLGPGSGRAARWAERGSAHAGGRLPRADR